MSPLVWLLLSLAGACEPTVTFGLAVHFSARYPLFARPSRTLLPSLADRGQAISVIASAGLEFLTQADAGDRLHEAFTHSAPAGLV